MTDEQVTIQQLAAQMVDMVAASRAATDMVMAPDQADQYAAAVRDALAVYGVDLDQAEPARAVMAAFFVAALAFNQAKELGRSWKAAMLAYHNAIASAAYVAAERHRVP